MTIRSYSTWCASLLLLAAACGSDAVSPTAPSGVAGATAGSPAAPAVAGQRAASPAGSLAADGGRVSAGGMGGTSTSSSAASVAGAGGVAQPATSAAGSGGALPTGSAAAGGGGSAAPPEPTQTCPMIADGLEPGDTTHAIMSNDRMRSYLAHVPSKYTGSEPVPLVLDFHGYSSSARGQMGASGFRELGDREGFIVVYPEGVGSSWHVNGCCGEAGMLKLDEVAFVRAIVDEVKAAACIDAKRVYATGISQGGGMAHHVGCQAGDIFTAVAPVSSDLRTEPCAPALPVTEISFRGLSDSLSAYEGGHVGPPGMDGYESIGAKQTLERWKTVNMCTGTAEKMGELCETYASCAGGTAVSLCSIPGADHVLYQNAQNLSVPEVAWELFKKHPR